MQEKGFVHEDLYRSDVTTLIGGISFSGSGLGITRNSSSVETLGYRKFILYLDIDSTGTPTDIEFIVQFSDDNSTFYDYQNDFFADLRYEDTATAAGRQESVVGDCIGSYFRLRTVPTGTSNIASFRVTAKVEFTD